MNGLLARLSPVLHLTRVTTAFAAIGNVWFVILWSRACEPSTQAQAMADRPLWALLGGGTLFALGMFSFAMALNDILDIRRDRALHPDRPLPSGKLSLDTAARLVALTLIVSVLGAATLGLPAVVLALGTAGAIVLFNLAAKYIPSAGLVSLGLIYGAHMMTPNVHLVFVWPVWLAMTHALLVGAVTHRLAGRRPALTLPMLAAAGAGWAFWSGVLLYVGRVRAGAWWPDWVPLRAAIWPGMLVLAFLVFAGWRVRRAGITPRAGEKLQRYGAFWLTLYAAAWMIGVGRYSEAGVLGGLALAGYLGMTLLRELYNLVEHPVAYRR